MTEITADVRTIDQHIAQHAAWKRRLRELIDSGQTDLDLAEVKRDDRCEFGKWLQGLGGSSGERAAEIRRLHAEFHKEASEIIRLVRAGQKDEATKSMELSGRFAKASSALTVAMMNWKKELK